MSSDSDSSLSSPATSEKRKSNDDNEGSGSHSPKSPTQPALIPHSSVESTSSSPKSSASEAEKDKKQENEVELEDKRPLEGEDANSSTASSPKNDDISKSDKKPKSASKIILSDDSDAEAESSSAKKAPAKILDDDDLYGSGSSHHGTPEKEMPSDLGQVIPDLSSNEEDDDEPDDLNKKEFTVDDIVGPRMYSDPEEEKEEVEEVQPTIIESDMPRCRANLGPDGPLFAKLPNFLSIDTKPFNPETYEDEAEADEVLDDDGKSRLKLKIENTIRWRIRKDEQGNDIKESNAKMVRWSDGTSHNHLFTRQGQVLQAQAVFAEKLKFRPHSTDTLTHRKVTMSMADKTSRTQKVKVIADISDRNPETMKQEIIRQEEDKMRAIARREAQQRRTREKPRQTGLSSGFLEGYDSDEGESLSAIKRRYQQGQQDDGAPQEYSSESEEDNTKDIERAKSVAEAKMISSGEDSEQEESTSFKKLQQKKKIVIEEDDE